MKASIPMNEALEKLTKDELIELVTIYSKDWLACDGLWFQACEKACGMEFAMERDQEIWRSFTVTEARRIKKFLKLDEHPGLEGLEKAMRLRLYANINRESYEYKDGKLIYRTIDCDVQMKRQDKGLEWHPCKAIGVIEFPDFAKVIDERIECRCISCYPELAEGYDGCCAWEFSMASSIAP